MQARSYLVVVEASKKPLKGVPILGCLLGFRHVFWLRRMTSSLFAL